MYHTAIDGDIPNARMMAAREEALAQEKARQAKKGGPPPVSTSRRKPPTMWAKGQSGNPHGRPKVLVNLRELAREHTETAIRVLVEVALDRKAAPGGRVAAAEALLDRGYGKPLQQTEVSVSVIDRLSDGDRAAVLQILDAVAAARPVDGGQLEALPAPDATPDATPAGDGQT